MVDDIDPITLAVIQNEFIEIAAAMDATLVRTAFSPIISEAQDRGSGVYAADGAVIAQGPSSLPLFITTMQDAVKEVIAAHPDLGDRDVIVVNDPYLVGTHMMDVRLVRPFSHGGEVVFYLSSTGHWTDIGGMVPGSFCVTAREIQQEGLRIPPVHIMRAGELQTEMIDLICANVRTPGNARGDLFGQLASLDIGVKRLEHLIERFGIGVVVGAVGELNRRGELSARAFIREIPDGTYEAESILDNDGIDPDPLFVKVRVTVVGDEISCDFSGSTGWVKGPLNSTEQTTRAGVLIALKHMYPDLPTNAGCFVPIHVHVPADTFLNAPYPKAVSGCSAEISSASADAVLRALCDTLPGLVPAGAYRTMAAFTLGGIDPADGRPYVLFSFNGGGYGGSATGDGLANAPLPIGIAQSAPVEVMEQQYPVLYEQCALRENSGGPGRHRGGLGTSYRVRILRGQATAAALMNNALYPPWGSQGGGDGSHTDLRFDIGGELTVPALKSKIDGLVLQEGDSIVLDTPGGGGWGPPGERPAELILADLAEGYYDRETLIAQYGTEWQQEEHGND